MTDQETADGSDHHVPAPDDWPRGFGEASWWPFVAALGAGALYVGLGLVVLSQGDDPLAPTAGAVAVAAAGGALLLAGLVGWIAHAFVERVRPEGGGASPPLRWGTLLFLGSEAATFGAVFFYYFWIRAGPWPPGELPDLLTSLVAVNTLILLSSSVTIHLAHRALRRGDHRRFTALLVATLALGVVFLGGQIWEYYQVLVVEGYAVATGSFSSAFFGLTGLHGLHVLFGILGLAVLSARALRGEYAPEHHTSVTTVSLYWHFVDAVWIVLVLSLYVGAAVGA